MYETVLCLAATLGTVAVLIRITPPRESPVALIFATIAFFAVVAVARHGPDQIVAVLDALARLRPG